MQRRQSANPIFALIIYYSTAALLAGHLQAVNVTLAWDDSPSPNIAGYRLYSGFHSGVYTQAIEVGLNRSTVVFNLTPGRTYFFAVTGYNAASQESAPSNEISYTPPSPSPTAIPTLTPSSKSTPNPGSGPAVMIGPAPGSTFSSSTIKFQWTAGSATQYALTLGSRPNGVDIYSTNQISELSAIATAIPVDGRTVYATLYSKVGNSWISNAYVYTAFNGSATPTPNRTPTPTPIPTATPTPMPTPIPTASPTPKTTLTPTPSPGSGPAVMISPTPGSKFRSSTVTFQWAAGGATQYALTLGSNPKGLDIYATTQISALSTTATAIPVDGRTVYATLYSKVGNSWVSNVYTYTAGP
jgi:hypothetical protein